MEFDPQGGRQRAMIHGGVLPNRTRSPGVHGGAGAQAGQAARHDPLAQLKEDYRNNASPGFQTFGPMTRRKFLRLQRSDARPG